MGLLAVVVLDVRLQHRAEMAFAQEEHPIDHDLGSTTIAVVPKVLPRR